MKNFLKKGLKKLGYQLKKYHDDTLPRKKVLAHFHINKVLDVGANIGQFSLSMRRIGFDQTIISFEPQKAAFEKLKVVAGKEHNWQVYNYALGDQDGTSVINISENSVSSSILNILSEHIKSAPESVYVANESIEIKKLDSIFNAIVSKSDNILLKIDTQGYEKNVIIGAAESLAHISVIQLEMSIVPLYEKEMLFNEMINFLDNKGFELYSLENGFSDEETGKLLQVDGIFVNRKIAASL